MLILSSAYYIVFSKPKCFFNLVIIKCRLQTGGIRCRLRPKLSLHQIRDIFSSFDLCKCHAITFMRSHPTKLTHLSAAQANTCTSFGEGGKQRFLDSVDPVLNAFGIPVSQSYSNGLQLKSPQFGSALTLWLT